MGDEERGEFPIGSLGQLDRDLLSAFHRALTRRQFNQVLGGATLATILGPTLLAACNSSSPTSTKTSLTIESNDVPAGADSESAAANQFQTMEAMQNLYATLLTFKKVAAGPGYYNIDLSSYVGEMAESWTANSDLTLFTIKLKQGIKSAAGNELTTDDILFSWQRAFGLSLDGAFIAGANSMKDISAIKVIDKYSFSIETQAPDIVMLGSLTLTFPEIWDSKVVKAQISSGDAPWGAKYLADHGAGFGPYQLTELVEGQRAVFQANPNYFEGAPKISKVTYLAVPEDSSRLALLVRGDVDIAEDLTAKELAEVSKLSGLKVVSIFPGNDVADMGFNVTHPPFDNPLVRQAIAYALPYDEILKTVYLGTAQRWYSPFFPVYPGYTDQYGKQYVTDVAKAKSLLQQAGYGSGFSAQLTYALDLWDMSGMAIVVASGLAQAGINVQLNPLPATQLETRRVGKQINWWLSNTETLLVPEAVWGLDNFFISTSFLNYYQYVNPQMDALTIASRKEVDQAKRNTLYDQAQKILMDDLPVIPIALVGRHVAMKANLNGYTWSNTRAVRFKDLSFA